MHHAPCAMHAMHACCGCTSSHLFWPTRQIGQLAFLGKGRFLPCICSGRACIWLACLPVALCKSLPRADCPLLLRSSCRRCQGCLLLGLQLLLHLQRRRERWRVPVLGNVLLQHFLLCRRQLRAAQGGAGWCYTQHKVADSATICRTPLPCCLVCFTIKSSHSPEGSCLRRRDSTAPLMWSKSTWVHVQSSDRVAMLDGEERPGVQAHTDSVELGGGMLTPVVSIP